MSNHEDLGYALFTTVLGLLGVGSRWGTGEVVIWFLLLALGMLWTVAKTNHIRIERKQRSEK